MNEDKIPGQPGKFAQFYPTYTPGGGDAGRWPQTAPLADRDFWPDPRAAELRREHGRGGLHKRALSARERRAQEAEFAFVQRGGTFRVESNLHYDAAARCTVPYGDDFPIAEFRGPGSLIDLIDPAEARELLMAGLISVHDSEAVSA